MIDVARVLKELKLSLELPLWVALGPPVSFVQGMVISMVFLVLKTVVCFNFDTCSLAGVCLCVRPCKIVK